MRHFTISAIACVLALASVSRSDADTGSVLSCTPSGANLADPVPLHLTAAQREVAIQSYSAPEVRGLSSQFRGTVAGTAKESTRKVLANVPPALLRDRFYLLLDQRASFGGGDFLTIEFRHHPEAIYRTWVYPLSTGEWDVRTWERARCSPAQQRFIQITFGEALKGLP